MTILLVLWFVGIFTTRTDSFIVRHEHFVFPWRLDNTNIRITSDIQGTVEWKQSRDTSVEVFVTVNDERSTPTSSTEARVVIEKDALSKISIRVIKTPDHVTLPLNSISLAGPMKINLAMTSLLLLLSLVFDRSLLLALGILVCLLASSGQCILIPDWRCKIVVFYPRQTTFAEIDIALPDSRIYIPRGIMKSTENVSCSTGATIHKGKGCPSCCYGNGFCGPGDICKCFQGYDPLGSCEYKAEPIRKLFTNKLDQRIAELIQTDVTSLLVRGRRHRNGKVKHITEIVSRDQNGKVLNIRFADGKRRTRLKYSNSSDAMSLIWNGRCKVHVSVWKVGVWPPETASIVINTCSKKVTMAKIGNGHESSAFKKLRLSVRSDENSGDFLSIDEGSYFQNTLNNPEVIYRKEEEPIYIEIPIELKSCNPSIQRPRVYAVISNVTDPKEEIRFEATHSELNGYFTVRIPIEHPFAQKQTARNRMRMCQSFRKSVKRLCTEQRRKTDMNLNTSYTCEQIKNSTLHEGNSSINHGDSVTYMTSFDSYSICKMSDDVLNSFCKTFNKNVDSCPQYFNKFENFYFQSDNRVQVIAVFKDGRVLKSSLHAFDINKNATKTVTDKVVLFDNVVAPTLQEATIFPRRPKPSHGYAVRMGITCATPSTVVRMFVTGNDNYSNDVMCRGPQECNCCVLYVAGGGVNVSDNITVTMTDQTIGANETRSFIVNF